MKGILKLVNMEAEKGAVIPSLYKEKLIPVTLKEKA